MHTDKTVAPTNMPAIVLALVLLGAVAAGSFPVAQYVLMAPSTLLPAPNPKPINARPANMANADRTPDTLAEIASGPGWETLTTPQKLALFPLANRWKLLSNLQKRRWLALAQGFENIGIVDFRKDFQYGRDFQLMLLKKLISFAVTMVLAYQFRSYWALLGGMVASRLMGVVLTMTMVVIM